MKPHQLWPHLGRRVRRSLQSKDWVETLPFMMDTSLVPGKVDWRERPAKKDKHGGTFNSLFVLALYGLDSFATMALAVNISTYFTDVMHFDVDEATKILTDFMGTSYILTIVAAYISDAFLARYKVILVSSAIEILGLILLTVQAKTQKLKPIQCNPFDPTSAACEKVRGRDSAFLYISIYLIAVGTAGIKACVPAHGADQFDEEDPNEAKKLSSYFNWLFLSASIGATISLILIVWVQSDVGWGWGFGVSLIGIFVGTVIFIIGLPRYRVHAIQKTDPITSILQVYIASFRNRYLDLPENPKELHEIDFHGESAQEVEFLPHTESFRFLDKAAIKQPGEPCSWKLCRVSQVEGAKIMLAMIPIFFSTIIMSICLTEFLNYSINQGITMDTYINKLKVPATPFLAYLFMSFLVPIYHCVFVPFARKITGYSTGITHFHRVAAGIVFSIVAMIAGAILEVKRKKVSERRDMVDAIPLIELLPISFFWLSFQYFFYAVSQVLIFVGLLEFFYVEAPRGLKSSATCFLWASTAIGYFMSIVVVNWVNDATKNNTATQGWLVGLNLNRNHLNYFYWMLAVLSFINLLNFLFWARWYKYRSHNSNVRVRDENEV